MTIPSSHARVRDALLRAHFESLFTAWGASNPPRTKVHASSLIVSKDEWCEREYVLAGSHPEEAQTVEQEYSAHLNAIFVNGWTLHQKWQNLFKRYARVVMKDGKPSLDLTYHHREYDLYYSPDAILIIAGTVYPIEIKGINTDEYQAACDAPLEEAVKYSETIRKARIQVTLYMHLLKLQQGAILAEDKNTQRFRVWCLQYDESLIAEYLKRLISFGNATFSYQHEGLLSRRNACCTAPGAVRARKCPMRGLCFRVE